MSPNVGNFVQDLVEMAKATEQLPIVQHERDEARHNLDRALNDVASREEHILRLKAEIETLQSDKNKLEAQRDDAEYRFLEADERTTKALDFVKTMFGSAGALVQALEPSRVEQPKAIDHPLHGDPQVSEVKPIEANAKFDYGGPYNEPISEHERNEIEAIPMQGQSEPSPTPAPSGEQAASGASTTTTADASASSPEGQSAERPLPDAGTTQSSSSSADTQTADKPADAPSTDPAKPYAGLKYGASEAVRGYHFVSLAEWIAGGGTEDNWYA